MSSTTLLLDVPDFNATKQKSGIRVLQLWQTPELNLEVKRESLTCVKHHLASVRSEKQQILVLPPHVTQVFMDAFL